jgi:6-pyruvoyltetrahydropterin/6-carboxytetrahydropterin synthase
MNKIRLTKQFNFEMAHALWNYDGSCRNVHGHSYVLFVTVTGEPENDSASPKNGMVMDFSDFKKIVKSKIVDELDHCFVISSDVDVESLKRIDQMFEKMKVFEFQPTCENLLIHIAETVSPLLPDKIKLHSLKLCETPTSFAEWFADDQK